MVQKDENVRVTTAVKPAGTEAPLMGAPVEYLDGGAREKSYTLLYPFKLAGTEYRVLTIKKLSGKQIFAVNQATRTGVTPEAALYSAMCSIPIAAAEALDSEDLKAISEMSANFSPQLFEAEEQTGANGENT